MKKCMVISLAAAGAAVAAAPTLYAGAIIDLPGFRANAEDRNDDGSTPQISLPFAVNFFGQSFNHLWVNTNGNVTFNMALATFTPDPLVHNATPIIAPYWADWDTRPPSNPAEPTPNQVTYGTGTVDGHQAFGVDWINIGYYNAHDDKLNSAQLILIDRSDTGAGNFDIEFNYDKIQWETGDASGGSGGLGGSSARVGYSNGTNATNGSFELPGSAVTGAFLDGGPDALVSHSLNSDVLGRYIFNARGGTVLPPPPPTSPPPPPGPPPPPTVPPPPSAVPLPAALWTGLSTLGTIGLAGKFRRRRK